MSCIPVAFSTLGAGTLGRRVIACAALVLAAAAGPPRSDAACAPGPTVLCLAGDRFRVQAAWRTDTATGEASAVKTTAGSGYFTFFGPDSPEVVVKAINGCAFNGRFWIFAAGMTNVEVVLTVTDDQTHIMRTYVNPLGRTFLTQMDTNAFPACPEHLACANPAPLYGEFDSRAPGVFVIFREGVDVLATTQALATKYGFVPTSVYEFAPHGFFAPLTPETVSAIRCEPPVLFVEYDAVVSGPI